VSTAHQQDIDVPTLLLNHLAAQKQRLRNSDYNQYDAHNAEIEEMVQILSQTDQHESLTSTQWEALMTSFRELTLMVASHKQIAADQLQQLRQGKRTLSAYQGTTA
jgi:hypothetical protein